jgi:PDZ domain-containing protein
MAIGGLELFAGAGPGGIWLVFLGFFVFQSARDEAVHARVESALGDVRVGEMVAAGPSSPAWVPAAGPADLPAGLPAVRAADRVVDALPALTEGPGAAIVVDDGGREVGVLTSADILRAVQLERLRPGVPEQPARSLAVWLVVGLAIVVAAGALYHPPYVVIEPGESFDVSGDVTISGTPTEEPSGRYLLTSVRVRRSNAFGTLWAAWRTDREVLAVDDVLPEGIAPDAYAEWQRDLFADSRQLAAVAAARAAGLEASVTGSGAEVIGVVRSAPAASAVQPGDVIVAVDGQPITTADELRAAVAGHRAGARFTLALERDGERSEVTVRSARLPQVSGGTGLGLLADTRDLRAVLPFRIRFRDRPDVGGPSAGLAYALAISDMLDTADDARRRAVAATGTVDAEGDVGEVGGVAEKAVAADSAGADVLIVPADETDDARRVSDLPVYGADELAQALRLLRTSP